MGRVLFLSTYRLKKNTPIQQNVDDDLLNPYIYKAQETHIQQILGTNLYDSISDMIINNTIGAPQNVNYKKILENVLTLIFSWHLNVYKCFTHAALFLLKIQSLHLW